MISRIPKGAARIPKGAARIPKGAAEKWLLSEVTTLQRVTWRLCRCVSLSTFSTLSTGGEAPRVLAYARHPGAAFSQPAPHRPQHDAGGGIVREGVHQEHPEGGQLRGGVGLHEQPQQGHELGIGHAPTVRRARHRGVTWAAPHGRRFFPAPGPWVSREGRPFPSACANGTALYLTASGLMRGRETPAKTAARIEGGAAWGACGLAVA